MINPKDYEGPAPRNCLLRTLKDGQRLPDNYRNPMGWPTIEPDLFLTSELIFEAAKWAGMRGMTPYVGGSEFQKYFDELWNRKIWVDWSVIPYDPD